MPLPSHMFVSRALLTRVSPNAMSVQQEQDIRDAKESKERTERALVRKEELDKMIKNLLPKAEVMNMLSPFLGCAIGRL